MTNEDIWQGRWKQIKGRVQATWGTLTGDELDELKGKRQELIGRIQTKTGEARAEVEKQLDKIERELAS